MFSYGRQLLAKDVTSSLKVILIITLKLANPFLLLQESINFRLDLESPPNKPLT